MRDLYRKNVGIVLCKKGKVLLFARADQKGLCWQFPQGGIEENEEIVDAAKRELLEETGLYKIKLLYVMPTSLKYDFPENLQKKWKNRKNESCTYKGQEQYWVLFEFLGDETDINFLNHPEEIEFKDYKWDDISKAPNYIVPFKKHVYEEVVKCFTPFIRENNHDR